MYWDQITQNLEGFAKDFGLYPEAEGTSKIPSKGVSTTIFEKMI